MFIVVCSEAMLFVCLFASFAFSGLPIEVPFTLNSHDELVRSVCGLFFDCDC